MIYSCIINLSNMGPCCSFMQIALIHGCVNRAHALSASIEPVRDGRMLVKVEWRVHTWFKLLYCTCNVTEGLAALGIAAAPKVM